MIKLENYSLFDSEKNIIKLLYFTVVKFKIIKQEVFSKIKKINNLKNENQTENNDNYFKSMTEELTVINSIVSFKTKENNELTDMIPPTNLRDLTVFYTKSFNNLQKSLGDKIKRKFFF